MKSGPLSYVRVTNVDDAVRMLSSEPSSAALAGGQSLMPALALREREYATLIDISEIAALRGLEVTPHEIRIGAGEPLSTLEHSAELARLCPLLHRAVRTVGAMAIRSRCTLGGSLAWGDASSQLPAALGACDAVVTTTCRKSAVADLLSAGNQGPWHRDELIVSITIPARTDTRTSLRHLRRTHITWPTAGAVAVVDDARVTLGLYGAAQHQVIIRSSSAEEALAQVPDLIDPYDDARASAGYRRRVLPILAGRALADAEQESR